MIHLERLTKDYGPGRGLFDVSFDVLPGSIFGFIGPNGAGKSTAIRHLMGLISPDTGRASIGGYDCWKQSSDVKRLVGYLPGEISLPAHLTGDQVLDLMMKLHGASGKRRDELLRRFPFDTDTRVRKMSKGTKQKLALVGCFMKDAPVYLLDEPTSGIDPLMQERFMELALEEKARGKAILMSSHHFPEMEKTCDRAALIKEGRIVVETDIDELIRSSRKQYRIELGQDAQAERIAQQFGMTRHGRQVEFITSEKLTLNAVIQVLAECDVRAIHSSSDDLEQVFMHYYMEEESP
ncbi:ABC transporter ATP-binding protein [Exiguobacterium flavidum]|uniref:ABC transporter ATP-binding protein n=1 Tax=Exiguobacterium flavidum TaxID=2184695 RepID=UPI000DF7CD6D|nr:ABC transporter ATP-binding protein [Exiguobacterium flavidum]